MELHLERNLVINHRELKHQGIFHLEEVFHTLNKALETRGYTLREKKTEESVVLTGKMSLVELRPFKEKSSYLTLLFKIKIQAEEIRDLQVKVGMGKQLFQQGNLTLVLDAWILSDYAQRWGMNPLVYFLKGVINKYIYTWPMEAGFVNELHDDAGYLIYQFRQLLKTYQPPREAVPHEAEVMHHMAKKIEEEELAIQGKK